MDLGLEGRVALVTGASRGLGHGVAMLLASEGAEVAIASRSREHVEAAASGHERLTGFVHDTRDVDGAATLVAEVEARLGPVDILVASTGGPPGGADALAFGREQWQAAYEQLVLGTVALIERLVPGMRERGFGRIVSVSSTSVREPIPSLVLSTAHRAGLAAALKTISRQVAADGITVNSVLPGRIATDRMVGNYGSLEAANRRAAEEIPAGRLGTVEEFAAAVAFLCSTGASYVTGTQLVVDGGLTRSV